MVLDRPDYPGMRNRSQQLRFSIGADEGGSDLLYKGGLIGCKALAFKAPQPTQWPRLAVRILLPLIGINVHEIHNFCDPVISTYIGRHRGTRDKNAVKCACFQHGLNAARHPARVKKCCTERTPAQ